MGHATRNLDARLHFVTEMRREHLYQRAELAARICPIGLTISAAVRTRAVRGLEVGRPVAGRPAGARQETAGRLGGVRTVTEGRGMASAGAT